MITSRFLHIDKINKVKLTKKVKMVNVYLIIDPKTGYALYEDQREFKGTYSSTQAAIKSLGELFKYCKVVTVK